MQKKTATAILSLFLPLAAAISAQPVVPATAGKAAADSNAVTVDSSATARQRAAAVRTGNVLSLLAAEMALQAKEPGPALATYLSIFEKTHDAGAGVRAVEIALAAGSPSSADMILQKWQALLPGESADYDYGRWLVAAAKSDAASAKPLTASVFAQADDPRLKQLFLQAAQLALRVPAAAEDFYPVVHRYARDHDDMTEALVADAVVSALSDHKQDAATALGRLAASDAALTPVADVAVRAIGRYKPDVLEAFFKQSDISALPPGWQSLYISTLVDGRKTDTAYARLQELLKSERDPALLLQAGFLSVGRGADLDTTRGYLQGAYDLGDREQKNKSAFLMAVRLLQAKDTDGARLWANRVDLPSLDFDKTMLLLSVEQASKNRPAALLLLQKAEKSTQKGLFFSKDDLLEQQLIFLRGSDNTAERLERLNSWIADARQHRETGKLAVLLYERGLLYADALHNPAKAVADFRQFLALRPEDPDGMNALGYTLLSLPDSKSRKESLALLQQAYRSDSDSVAINDSLGWALFKNGEAEKSLTYLRYAFENSDDAETAAHFGEVLWTLGRKNEALSVWKKGATSKSEANSRRVLQNTLKRLGVSQAALLSAADISEADVPAAKE